MMTISKQAKDVLLVLFAYTLAFASPACADTSPASKQDRVISIHMMLFEIYRKQQKLEDCMKEGNLLASLTKPPKISRTLGDLLFSKQRYSEALAYYQRALRAGDTSDALNGKIGATLMQLKRFDEAAAWYKRQKEELHPLLEFPVARGSDVAWNSAASNGKLRTSMMNGSGRQMQPIAMLPASANRISVTINVCDFKLVHEERNDILLIANYPNHWKNISGSQTQIEKGNYPLGHFHTINGEDIWIGAATIGPDGIMLNGKLFQKFPADSSTSFLQPTTI